MLVFVIFVSFPFWASVLFCHFLMECSLHVLRAESPSRGISNAFLLAHVKRYLQRLVPFFMLVTSMSNVNVKFDSPFYKFTSPLCQFPSSWVLDIPPFPHCRSAQAKARKPHSALTSIRVWFFAHKFCACTTRLVHKLQAQKKAFASLYPFSTPSLTRMNFCVVALGGVYGEKGMC